MREVRINKDSLEAKVRENRDAHRDIYERAMEGYTKAVVKFFEDNLHKALHGRDFQTHFPHAVPQDHTDDYDTVLAMLAMSEDDTIVLSQSEFKQYVQDDWNWKFEFTTGATYYIGDQGEFPNAR